MTDMNPPGDGASDDTKLTAAGHEERRVNDDDRRHEDPDRKYVSKRSFNRWVCRIFIAFFLSTAIASASAYLSFKAGQDSQSGLQSNGVKATFDTCVSGAELRVTIAKGLDDLRSLAIDPKRVSGPVRDNFIRQTQPAIDSLLTQAAYGTRREAKGRVFHADLTSTPPGAVTDTVVAQIRTLAVVRCAQRAKLTFNANDKTLTTG